MDTIFKFVEKLKQHLTENKNKYAEHHSWMGDTESGFYDTDEFDMDELLKQIDEFSATFKKDRE